jgi:DNA-binding CsgD family transcriptional regulator
MNANSPYQEVIDRLVSSLSSANAQIAGYKIAIVKPVPPPAHISDKELVILELVSQGLTRDQVAERIGVSPDTVKTHLARLRERWNARSSAQLVAIAKDAHLLPPRTQ